MQDVNLTVCGMILNKKNRVENEPTELLQLFHIINYREKKEDMESSVWLKLGLGWIVVWVIVWFTNY